MSRITSFLSSRKLIIITGIFAGVLAPVLQKLGNPGNMGICVACFIRDIAGALGLHRAAVVQYLRPEIIGIVLGAFLAASFMREFKPRTGSAPIIRFFLGFFAMIGALVFLGCPWRMILRLAGGDGNAIFGLVGFIVGIWIGAGFLKRGYTLGKSASSLSLAGLVLPLSMVALLFFAVFQPQFSEGGPIFFSAKGPGAAHAPLLFSLFVGLGLGYLGQRSRFCTAGGFRDLFLIRDTHLLSGVIALLISAFVTNLILTQFHPGFVNQPIAHTNEVWNFFGMVLAGLAFILAGGCPGRQLILSGEGDGDAGVFVVGMVIGAAFSHNFSMASSPTGVGAYGPVAVIIGIAFCLAVAFLMKEGKA